MDVIRTARGESLLRMPLLALQQAELHQAAARYQLVQAQLKAHVMPPICPVDDRFLLLAGLPNLVLAHGVQLTGEPVVDQLHQLLTLVDVWSSHYPDERQLLRLLALWLDKLLRMAMSTEVSNPDPCHLLSLGPLKRRCLGRLDTPWCEWAEGRPSLMMPSSDGMTMALQLALQAFIRDQAGSKGLTWLLEQTEGKGGAVKETAVLLYGALVGPFQVQSLRLPCTELESKRE